MTKFDTCDLCGCELSADSGFCLVCGSFTPDKNEKDVEHESFDSIDERIDFQSEEADIGDLFARAAHARKETQGEEKPFRPKHATSSFYTRDLGDPMRDQGVVSGRRIPRHAKPEIVADPLAEEPHRTRFSVWRRFVIAMLAMALVSAVLLVAVFSEGKESSSEKVEESSGESVRENLVQKDLQQAGASRGIAFSDEKSVEIKGAKYRLVKEAGSYSLMLEERSLLVLTAEDAWLFEEEGSLYVVATTANSWTLAQIDIGGVDGGALPEQQEIMRGSGVLETAYFVEGKLYYSLKDAAWSSPLSMRDVTGSFAEYSDMRGAVALDAEDRSLAAATHDGKLLRLDVVTGVVFDNTNLLEQVPTNIGTNSDVKIGSGVLYVRDAAGRTICVDEKASMAWIVE